MTNVQELLKEIEMDAKLREAGSLIANRRGPYAEQVNGREFLAHLMTRELRERAQVSMRTRGGAR